MASQVRTMVESADTTLDERRRSHGGMGVMARGLARRSPVRCRAVPLQHRGRLHCCLCIVHETIVVASAASRWAAAVGGATSRAAVVGELPVPRACAAAVYPWRLRVVSDWSALHHVRLTLRYDVFVADSQLQACAGG